MNNRIAVIVPNLTDRHRQAIRETAAKNGCEVRFLTDPDEDREYVYSSGIIFGHQPEAAKASEDLQWLCTPFAGIDQFMAENSFANPDAMLTNSSGAYGVTIAEHILMLLLAILRRDPEYRAFVQRKEWKRDLPIRSIFGSRVVLLGTGDIGRETARRLKAFQPETIIGINRSGKDQDRLFSSVFSISALDRILPETDILIISLPGTGETYHIMNKERLNLLPDQAIINVGRGSVVDQGALTAELDKGRLQAGLDVFEKEPIQQDDPLWTQKGLLMTPHTAGNMTLPHTVDRIVEMFLEDLNNYCAGRPLLHLVDCKRGY